MQVVLIILCVEDVGSLLLPWCKLFVDSRALYTVSTPYHICPLHMAIDLSNDSIPKYTAQAFLVYRVNFFNSRYLKGGCVTSANPAPSQIPASAPMLAPTRRATGPVNQI